MMFNLNKVTWSNSALAHSKAKGYSRRYLSHIIENPERVVQACADTWTVYGYGYGMVVATRGRGFIVVNCFTDDGPMHSAVA